MTARTKFILALVGGGALITLTMGLRQSFGLFLPGISETFQGAREVFSFALALQNLCWGLLSPIFGGIADRWGPAKVAAVGALLYAGGLLYLSLSTQAADLIFAQILIGFGLAGAGFSVVLGSVARAASDENRSMALAITTAAGSFGQFAMVPIADYFLQSFGWQTAALVLAATALLMLPFVFGIRGDGMQRTQGIERSGSFSNYLKKTLSHIDFVLLGLGFFVCGIQVVFIATHLPSYLRDSGIGPSVASLSLAMIGLFNIFGTLACGWLGHRYPKKTVLTALYLLRSFVILAFITLPLSDLSAIVFGAAIGLLWLGTVPLTSGLIGVFFGTTYMSMFYGVAFFSHQVGSFLGAWLGGRLYDLTGNYDLMWWIVIFFGLVAALFHWPIRERYSAIPEPA